VVNGTLTAISSCCVCSGYAKGADLSSDRKSANVQRGIETRGHKCCLVKELSSLSIPLGAIDAMESPVDG
jgi:hypothetical protein